MKEMKDFTLPTSPAGNRMAIHPTLFSINMPEPGIPPVILAKVDGIMHKLCFILDNVAFIFTHVLSCFT